MTGKQWCHHNTAMGWRVGHHKLCKGQLEVGVLPFLLSWLLLLLLVVMLMIQEKQEKSAQLREQVLKQKWGTQLREQVQEHEQREQVLKQEWVQEHE
jgi:sensor domain CHASE-containing protein